jgi:hypothetical protein
LRSDVGGAIGQAQGAILGITSARIATEIGGAPVS